MPPTRSSTHLHQPRMNESLSNPSRSRNSLRSLAALLLAALLWFSFVHWLFARSASGFSPRQSGIAPKAQVLAARHLQLWTNAPLRSAELDRMRRSNAEWDFMGRSFLVWSLAEMGLRDPARKDECLAVMDQIIVETLKLEEERGKRIALEERLAALESGRPAAPPKRIRKKAEKPLEG